MSARLRSMTRSGSMLVLAGLVLAAGCLHKRRVRAPLAPPAVLGLQSVIAVDKDGNQILAGSFRRELSVVGSKLQGAGGTDIFIVKTNPKGGLVFPPQRFGGPGEDAATGIAVDTDGSIVLVGTFQGEATFGTVSTKANVRHAGQRAVFAAKLDGAGKVLWVKQIAVANLPTQVSVAIRPDHNLVLGVSGTGTVAGKDGMVKLSGESVTLALISPAGEPLPVPPETTALMLRSADLGCAHSPCHEGAPLDPACGFYGCVAWICAHDDYCCKHGWDGQCIGEVVDWCGFRCDCGDVGTVGPPFYPDASPCVAAVCNDDGYCGEFEWDPTCVAETDRPECHPPCR